MIMRVMVIWWYSAGLKLRFSTIGQWIESSFDYFSIELLARTFFAPFRQISAGYVRGPVDVQIRAFIDRTVSRLIGMAVRSLMIIAGSIFITMQVLIGLVSLFVWIVIPVVPLLGVLLFLIGWMPWTR